MTDIELTALVGAPTLELTPEQADPRVEACQPTIGWSFPTDNEP
jgi:hypothetical protein